jgi:hypothetical protein
MKNVGIILFSSKENYGVTSGVLASATGKLRKGKSQL